jgi:hypothetical protein
LPAHRERLAGPGADPCAEQDPRSSYLAVPVGAPSVEREDGERVDLSLGERGDASAFVGLLSAPVAERVGLGLFVVYGVVEHGADGLRAVPVLLRPAERFAAGDRVEGLVAVVGEELAQVELVDLPCRG